MALSLYISPVSVEFCVYMCVHRIPRPCTCPEIKGGRPRVAIFLVQESPSLSNDPDKGPVYNGKT